MKPPEMKLKPGVTENNPLFRWRENVFRLQELKGLPDLSNPATPGSPGPVPQPIITVEAIATGEPQLLQQLRGAQGQTENCSFQRSSVGRASSVRDSFDFQNCLITEVGIPALDAASKDAAKMSIKITPEWGKPKPGSSPGTPPAAASKSPPPKAGPSVGTPTGGPMKEQKLWAPANFRLELPGAGAHELKKVEGLPSVEQLRNRDWASLRLEGPTTKTRVQMLEWYKQLSKPPQPKPQPCSIVVDYAFPGGSASRRYDFTDCFLTGYCLPCLEAGSGPECQETVTIHVGRSEEFTK